MKKIEKEGKREFFFDILRLIAIFGVLYNHRPCFDLFATMNCYSIKGILLIILSLISRCGPPIFLMISGALLLKKEESFKRIFTHRIIRILIVMIIISGVQTYRNDVRSFEYFLQHLLGINNWYLYSYLGYLFMLPFLRKIAIHAEDKEKFLFLIMTTIFYTVSIFFIEYFQSYHFSLLDTVQIYSANWASGCWHIVFPLLGYFSYTIISDKNYKDKFNIFVSIGTMISVVVCIIFIKYDLKINNGANLEQIRQHFILLPCVAIFIGTYYLGKLLQSKIRPLTLKILAELSACTFGVFLIEVNNSYSAQIYYKLWLKFSSLDPFWLSIVSILIEFFIYTFVIFLLRRIKWFRKIL